MQLNCSTVGHDFSKPIDMGSICLYAENVCRTFIIMLILCYYVAGGATLIFDTELVAVNGKKGSSDTQDEEL